eukprot:5437725-Amphidinium_carterae.1
MLLGSSASGTTRRALVNATSVLDKGLVWNPRAITRPNRALEQQVAIPYEPQRRPRLSPRAALRAPYAAGQQQNVAAQEGTI